MADNYQHIFSKVTCEVLFGEVGKPDVNHGGLMLIEWGYLECWYRANERDEYSNDYYGLQ